MMGNSGCNDSPPGNMAIWLSWDMKNQGSKVTWSSDGTLPRFTCPSEKYESQWEG